ncbi:hypothetical protein YC2023_101815 [Brassica napus]
MFNQISFQLLMHLFIGSLEVFNHALMRTRSSAVDHLQLCLRSSPLCAREADPLRSGVGEKLRN